MSSVKLSRAVNAFSKDLRNDLVASLKEHLEKENKLDDSMLDVLNQFKDLSIDVKPGKKEKKVEKDEDKPKKPKSGYAKFMSAFLKKNYAKCGNGTDNMLQCQATWKGLKEKFPEIEKDGNALFAKWEEEQDDEPTEDSAEDPKEDEEEGSEEVAEEKPKPRRAGFSKKK
jgi:hypothetical protein